jgi:hypothetical protein
MALWMPDMTVSSCSSDLPSLVDGAEEEGTASTWSDMTSAMQRTHSENHDEVLNRKGANLRK